MKERVILHCDLNSFYASVECFYHPELRNLPVAVGGEKEKRHGIILTKNPLAKSFGVQTGEALWQAKKKCPNLVILPPNYPLYLRYSELVRQIYCEYTDKIEPFGIDEAWLDVTESVKLFGSGEQIANILRKRVYEELGVTISVGVSWNKVFAKLGSDYKKPDATTVITKDNMQSIVWPLPVEDLLFVGPSAKVSLNALGIFTIGDLACADVKMLQEALGKTGPVLWSFANGLSEDPVQLYQHTDPIKSVGNSATSVRDIQTVTDLKTVAYVLAESIATRLREQKLLGRVIHVSIRDSKLKVITRQHKISYYTNTAQEIAEEALRLFALHAIPLFPLRSIGISVSDLKQDDGTQQINLFIDQNKRDKQLKLEKSLDDIRKKFGEDAVQRMIMAVDPKLSGFHPRKDSLIHPGN